jgi:DNA repair exonuclease SbcCD ATPase subunit
MKTNLFLFCFLMLLFPPSHFSQSQPILVQSDEKTQQSLETISTELTQLTKSLQIFNQRLNEFLESISKYKGVQLTERQQKLIFGFEILNQTEQLAATLRKSLVETSEREATIKRRIGQIQSDLRPENIERGIQFQGTTKAEEARENRRRTLEAERNTLQNLLFEVEASRSQISENLKEAEAFAQSFRKSLFAQVRNSIENL